MMDAWADTSGFVQSLQERIDPTLQHYVVSYLGFDTLVTPYTALEWEQRIHVLESFNGQYLIAWNENTGTTDPNQPFAVSGGGSSGGIAGPISLGITFTQSQIDTLDLAYNRLKEAVYNGLLLQTRFQSVVDLADVQFGPNGMNLDLSQVEQYFNDQIAANTASGLTDLIDFNRAASSWSGQWGGISMIEDTIRANAVTPELEAVYTDMNVLVAGTPGFSNTGTAASEIIVSGDTGDYIYGNQGDDFIFAGNGNDNVSGGDGADILDGGLGSDTLDGGYGNDVYRFGRGSGLDKVTGKGDRFICWRKLMDKSVTFAVNGVNGG